METFSNRKNLTRTITLMAMMCAVTVIMSLIGSIPNFLSVIIIIFLPITSTIVELNCEGKYYPIYALATIGLSIAASMWNFTYTLFYVLPSVATGFLFGLMTKKYIAPVWSIFAATCVQTLLSFALIPLTELVTGINIIDYTINLFASGWTDYKDYIILIFFVVSLIQVILSFIACNSQLKKFGSVTKTVGKTDIAVSLASPISAACSVGFFFLYKGLCYLFIAITFFFTYFIIGKAISNKQYKKSIIYALSFVANIILFAMLNPIMSDGQILLIQAAPLIIGIVSMFPF